MHVIHAHAKKLRRKLQLKFLEIGYFMLRSVLMQHSEPHKFGKSCLLHPLVEELSPWLSSKLICKFFFTEVQSCKWQCNKCFKSKSKNGGWTNFISHLQTCVGTDYERFFLDHRKATSSTSTMSAFVVRVSDREKEMHQWIEFIVMMNLPVPFVDSVHTRAIS